MTDIYIQDPSLLQGQPKRTLAEYVEKNGVLVPRRFQSLEEAMKSGTTFIMRSEHTQEYAGASGILRSFIIDSHIIREYKQTCTPEETNTIFKAWYIIGQLESLSSKDFERKITESRRDLLERYCKLAGIQYSDFIQQVKYSYWEKLGGLNRSIVADNAISQRYHLFTSGKMQDGKFFENYVIIENGGIVQEHLTPLPADLRQGLDGIILFYEKIRNLEGFDKNHCPLIEFQTVDENNYFLQYHKTRDSNHTTFLLNRKKNADEVEVDFVRGATQKEGVICSTGLYYPDYSRIYEEDASFDFHNSKIFKEMMTRRRKVQFVEKDLNSLLRGTFDGHLSKSLLFKPEISICIEWHTFLEDWETTKIYEKTMEQGFPENILVRVISDGKKAYIKRITKG